MQAGAAHTDVKPAGFCFEWGWLSSKSIFPAHQTLAPPWLLSHRLSATPGLSRLEVPSPSLLASQKRRLHLDFLPEEVHVAGCNSGGRCVIREAHLCFSQLTHVITQPLHDHVLWEVSCVVGLIRGAETKGPPLSKTNRTGKGYWEKR